MSRCRVCGANALREFARIDKREYLRCGECEATLLAALQLPSLEQERARYEQHRNDPDDPRYCDFVGRIIVPLTAVMPAPATGLDYGAGPGPALSRMLEARGYRMSNYDPIFAPDSRALENKYDFITCTETVEHFHEPMSEFSKLDGMLRPGGVLAIMTCFQSDDTQFANWHYRRDPTHVSFYRAKTFERIAQARGWQCNIPARNIAIMRKQ